MNQNLTELVIVLDKSGSMNLIKNDIIGSFNMLIEDQKKTTDSEIKITLTMFNHQITKKHISTNLADVDKLTIDNYCPTGNTALLDAVGETIDAVGVRFSEISEDERPSKVLFTIITDGEENCSKKYDISQIRKMIERQKNIYNWEFVFIGTDDIDCSRISQNLNILASNTYVFRREDTQNLMSDFSNATTKYRSASHDTTVAFAMDRDSVATTQATTTTII